MTLVAQAQVVALLEFDLLGCRSRAEGYVALEAAVWPLLLLGDIEMNGMLGKCLVLNGRRRLLRHLRVATHAVRGHELRGRHLLVVAVLARLPVRVADVAVRGAHSWLRFVVLDPVGRVRHRGLVTVSA